MVCGQLQMRYLLVEAELAGGEATMLMQTVIAICTPPVMVLELIVLVQVKVGCNENVGMWAWLDTLLIKREGAEYVV